MGIARMQSVSAAGKRAGGFPAAHKIARDAAVPHFPTREIRILSSREQDDVARG
jgi:hypothetical protein